MVSKSFQNKVDNMTNSQLVALHEDLRHRVETGKIGFGKRALNILIGVGAGLVGGEAASYLSGRMSSGFRTINVGEQTRNYATSFRQESRQNIAGDFRSARRGQAFSYAFTTLGVGIPTMMAANNRSKNKQHEKYKYAAQVLRERMEANGAGREQEGNSR